MGEVQPLHVIEREVVDLAHCEPFSLGPLHVVPFELQIRGNGQGVHLEPKVMQVLVALAREPDTIYSRDDLIDCVWDGRIVGDASVNRVMSLLRSALREVVGDAVMVETLPKVGYRLLVRDEEGQPAPAEVQEEEEDQNYATGRLPIAQSRALWLAVAIALILTLTGSLWWNKSEAVEPISLTILPMEISDGTDEFYANGLSDAMRRELGRQPGIRLLGIESARHLMGNDISAAEIGRRLRSDYVVHLTLTSEVQSIRLTARMIDSQTGNEVWQQTIGSAPGNASTLPERFTQALMRGLNRPVSSRSPSDNVSDGDYSLYLTAMGLLRSREMESRTFARQILEQVVERNPNFADGIAGYAKAYYLAEYSSPADREHAYARAIELAQQALARDEDAVDALKVAGMLAQSPQEGLAFLNRAVEIEPSDAEAWYWLCLTRDAALLPAERNLECAQRVVDLDPLWPPAWYSSRTAAAAGRLDLAIAMEQDIIAAATQQGPRLLAQARLARLQGDLSGYLRLTGEARQHLTPLQLRFGTASNFDLVSFLLGLDRVDAPYNEQHALRRQIEDGEPATVAQLEEVGLDRRMLWDTELVPDQIRALYLREDYEGLMAMFDARFSSLEEFATWADESHMATTIVPYAAAYLVPVLQASGDERRANQLDRMADRYFAQWQPGHGSIVYRNLTEMRLAASRGQNDRALAALRRLIDLGWPYVLGGEAKEALGPLIDDRVFDGLRREARYREIIAPVERQIARERAEVLADRAAEVRITGHARALLTLPDHS